MVFAGLRRLVWLGLAVVAALGAVDAGSVTLTNLTVPDEVRRAGQVAAATAADRPVSRRTARLAFEAASSEAQQHGIDVSTKGFTVYPDGRVTLTAGRTAPTLLLERVDPLRRYTEVRTTVTVEKLPYS